MNVISQSLDNYGFLALYHSTGPPYSLSIDIQSELSTLMMLINNDEFITDFQFQEYIQSLLQEPLDAHTRYQKPACYSATFIQPFAFDVRIIDESSLSSSSSSKIKHDSTDTNTSVNSNEMQLYIMKNKYTDIYATIYPNIPINSLINQQISLLNNLEFLTELSQWSDKYETKSNNRGIRFNAAIRSYLYRSAISFNVNSISDLIITLINGTSIILPWIGWYTSQLADINICLSTKKTTTKSNLKIGSGSDSDINDDENKHFKSIRDQYFLSHIYSEQATSSSTSSSPSSSSSTTTTTTESSEFITRSDRHIIIPSNNTYQLSCFVQSITPTTNSTITNINHVLVMKVSSFSPPGNGYIDAWTHFLDNAKQCLTSEHDMIIVDVMQNGGGYVCLGKNI